MHQGGWNILILLFFGGINLLHVCVGRDGQITAVSNLPVNSCATKIHKRLNWLCNVLHNIYHFIIYLYRGELFSFFPQAATASTGGFIKSVLRTA